MKKVLVTTIAGLALLAMSAISVSACDGAKGTSASADTKASCTAGTSAQMTSAQGTCASKTGATAQMTSGAAGCSSSKGASSASACLTAADYAKKVGYEGKAELVNMSIKGMTCGGCESSVSASLEKCAGVVKVISVNHAEGTALVLVDPAKAKNEVLTMAVSNKGYQAEIVPAVATATTSAAGKTCSAAEKAACATSKTCSAAEKAACAAAAESKGAAAPKTGAEGSN